MSAAAVTAGLVGISADHLGAGLTSAPRPKGGQGWAHPGEPWADADGGTHVARLGRANRRGLISGPDLVAALQTIGEPFTSATAVPWPGGAR